MSNGERYRRERGLPQFQRANLSGFSRAAAETGQQAAATGEAAQALGMRARVLEDVGRQAYEIGADLARQHGQSREIEPMRDGEGNMVPLVQRVTLNISDRIYQQRQREAWQIQAFNAYKERSEAEAKKHRLDPQAYSEAMAGVKQELLSRAPGSMSGTFEAQLDDFALGVRSGIDSLVTRTEQRAADLGIEQNLSREQTSFLTGITREERLNLFIDGKPNMDLYGDLLATRETIPLLSSGEQPGARYTPRHQVWNEDMERLALEGWFANYARGVRINHRENPSETENQLRNYQRMVEEDRVEVPGWSEDFENNPARRVFSDLSIESQEKLRGQMDRLRERLVTEARFANHLAHENFQARTIPILDNVRKAYPQEIPWKNVRNHIDALIKQKQTQGIPLTRSFVRSVIWNESRNNPMAGSPTGVIGLMQVTDATGRDMADRLGVPYNSDRQDPIVSTTYGIERLTDMWERSQGWCPGCNQTQRQALVAAAYNRGPGMMEKLLATGVDLRDHNRWMPVLEKLTMKEGKRTLYGKEGAEFAKRVMRSQAALTGGMGVVVDDYEAAARQRFPNPIDYMRAMTRFHSNWTQANSWAAFNQSLVHSPPAYDADLAQAFVDPIWDARFNPNTPNPQMMAQQTAQHITKLVQGDSAFAHQVQMQAYNRASRYMAGGMTTQARNAQRVMSLQGGALHSETDAKALDSTLPGGPRYRPLEEFRRKVAGGENALHEMALRYTSQGIQKNGRPSREQLDFTSLGMESLAARSLDKNELPQFLGFLEHFYGRMIRGGENYQFHRGVSDQARALETARDAVRRLRPGPGGSGAAMLSAMDFAMRNKAALLDNDKDAYKKLQRILYNEPIDDLWRSQTPEFKAQLNERIMEFISDGAPSYYANNPTFDILPSMANISRFMPNLMAREAIKQSNMMDEDTAGSSSLDYANESIYRNGYGGMSLYGYDPGVVYNEGYDPTKVALIQNPFDRWVNPYSNITPEHYRAFKEVKIPIPSDEPGVEKFDNFMVNVRNYDGSMESVSLIRGTLQGSLQAAYEDQYPDKKIDVGQEMADGKLKLFPIRPVSSPSGHPAILLQSMRFVSVSGTEEGEWVAGVAFDTGEMEEIARDPKFQEAQIRASRLAASWTDIPMGVARGLGFDPAFSYLRNPLQEMRAEARFGSRFMPAPIRMWNLYLLGDDPGAYPSYLKPEIPE